ncbi:general transcription factor IIH subunit TFB6 family [Aspergillus mulundensis]|uniref:Uncharacterized protein n=1 Tax=Aspergillus mulundensis TaxID=1810919 RepID=A0A3D8QHE9_9EURO|nr:Uncharacterized protein DSM5745_10750 [Aspergillus mulundensis]RDW61252.1 Uncharacterized protein DSM5745_10750 [Aspergillus mulundensis]
MTTNSASPGGGGFMQPSALSPAPSTSTVTPSVLPKQRTHPIRSGSIKEATVINHVDKTILTINRRHAKKFSSVFEQQQTQQNITASAAVGNKGGTKEDKERGYESFKEVVKDIEGVLDVLWVSGTPSLQIPYLISLSVLVNTYLPDYPFTGKATFRLLRKLDSFFASLILGEDAETGQPLSGFEGRRNVVSMTEKVRIKSIAEAARVLVVEKGDDRDPDADVNDDFEDESNDEMDIGMDLDLEGDGPDKWEMEAARVYEKTIQLLGDELGTEVEFCDEDMARGDEGENDISMSS